MAGIFLHDWDGSDVAQILIDFAKPADLLDEAEILVAAYEIDGSGYEGSAYVLYKKDGKLFEVEGSHCSCMGLEGQWEPDETTADTLRERIKRGGDWYINGVKEAVLAALDGAA